MNFDVVELGSIKSLFYRVYNNSNKVIVYSWSCQSTDDSTSFTVDPLSKELYPEGEFQFVVSFHPRRIASHYIAFILSNGHPGAAIEVNLTGECCAPAIKISPTLFDLGTFSIGSTYSSFIQVHNKSCLMDLRFELVNESSSITFLNDEVYEGLLANNLVQIPCKFCARNICKDLSEFIKVRVFNGYGMIIDQSIRFSLC